MITVLLGDASKLGLNVVVTEVTAGDAGEALLVGDEIHTTKAQDEQDIRACVWNSLAQAYQVLRNNGFHKITVGMPLFMADGVSVKRSAQLTGYTIGHLNGRFPETKDMDIILAASDERQYKVLKEVFR